MPKPLILASTSPRRKKLAKLLGVPFRCVDSRYREVGNKHLTPSALAKKHALGKAQNAAKSFPGNLVLGADTLGVFKGKIFGKPKNKVAARKMLGEINGRTIKVLTAFALINKTKKLKIIKIVTSYATLKKMSPAEISRYVNTGEPLDKAGAFAAQGIGAKFIKKIKGDFNNVVGFPVAAIAKELKKLYP